MCLAASAQNITGAVTNGTTGKPAAGADVTLLSLSQGMQEVGSTKTDAQGKFTFEAPAEQNVPHMVRVMHDGVSYFPKGGPLMPGTTTAEVTVFDGVKKVDGLQQMVEVNRLQSDGNQLQVIALFAVQNESKPPHTLVADRTFEFTLPEGATIDSGLARGPGGQPINDSPTEAGAKNRFAFSFPLKPGETQFQVSYHLPYSGRATFSPKPLAPVQHFVVMTAKGMSFTPKNAQRFQAMPDSPGVMVATDVKPGEDLAFSVAGTGQFQAEGQQPAAGGEEPAGSGMGGGQSAGRDSRPGGGLGAPIDSNDPLYEYRAVILGVFALILVMGGAYVIAKSNVATPAAEAAGSALQVPVTGNPAPADRNAKLLEAMKDELFHLELDRQQGKIAQDEYEKAKAALDETLKRALARVKN
jgi:5-hydroxyisourate hydrolase-like protein (transthyretin family)